MKVAIISSAALKSPPADYGGLESVSYQAAWGLSELGHETTLIAAKGSQAPPDAELIETVEPWDKLAPAQQKAYSDSDGVDRQFGSLKWRAHMWNGWRAHEQEAFGSYEHRLGGFGAVVDMSWAKWAYTTGQERVVGLCHSIAPYQSRPPREFAMLAGVSRGHSRNLSRVLRIPVRTLWNPVDIEAFPLETAKTDRVLSLNRIMPTKGIHHFVSLIERLKVKADVAGDDSKLVPDQGYVQAIREACKKSANLTYWGLVDSQKRLKLLQDAKVLVQFKDAGYEEVFGLSIVESLACGTPVVSVDTWGAQDIIENGKNGFIVKTPDEAAEAVEKIVSGNVRFDPRECRRSVERFSRQNIAKDYERLLKGVVAGSRW